MTDEQKATFARLQQSFMGDTSVVTLPDEAGTVLVYTPIGHFDLLPGGSLRRVSLR